MSELEGDDRRDDRSSRYLLTRNPGRGGAEEMCVSKVHARCTLVVGIEPRTHGLGRAEPHFPTPPSVFLATAVRLSASSPSPLRDPKGTGPSEATGPGRSSRIYEVSGDAPKSASSRRCGAQVARKRSGGPVPSPQQWTTTLSDGERDASLLMSAAAQRNRAATQMPGKAERATAAHRARHMAPHRASSLSTMSSSADTCRCCSTGCRMGKSARTS